MPANYVLLTNINCGESITSPYGLEIEYLNVSQQAANLTVTDSSGASIATSPLILAPCPDGTPVTVTVTLTFSNLPVSGDSISAMLTDANLNVISTDAVDNISVTATVATLPVQITAPPPGRGPKYHISTGVNLQGSFNAGLGNAVYLLIESRGAKKKRRKLEFLDTVAYPAAGTWQHGPLDNGYKGMHLLVVLTLNGVVKGTVRYILN
jgi:hypothetical protein